MKMVKSLLLGGAAGLVAVAGAQAADLPVKAKPVEYVKVCSLYGDGFWYVPGTDSCIKIGGWVRAEIAFATGNSDSPFISGATGRNDRTDSPDHRFRARTVTSIDVRTQTEYGTVRAYLRAGYTTDSTTTATGVLYAERAFVQMAGFTVGKTQSYFDAFLGQWSYGNCYMLGGSCTGASGTVVFAYTGQFGNGFTATLSLEDAAQRRSAIWDATNSATGPTPLTIGAFPGPLLIQDAGNIAGTNAGDYSAPQVPDIVGNLRVDQAWGSAQISGALHQIRSSAYGNAAIGIAGYNATDTGTAPSDKVGFAVNGGIVFNLPWARGDKFWVEATYTQGALSYLGASSGAYQGSNGFWNRFNGGSVAAAWGIEAIFANGIATSGGGPGFNALGQSNLSLTTGWAIAAAIEHYWTPALRTSVFGQWSSVSFDGTATTIFCQSPQSPVKTLAGGVLQSNTGCSPDFDLWVVGSRTIWNPVKALDIGVEVMYSKIETKFDPALVRLNFAGAGGRPGGLYVPSSEGVWSSIFRIQRNFWP